MHSAISGIRVLYHTVKTWAVADGGREVKFKGRRLNRGGEEWSRDRYLASARRSGERNCS